MKRYLLFVIAVALSLSAWADAPTIIRTQPEGTLRTYLRSGKAFYALYGEPTKSEQGMTVIDIVTAPDGHTIYMKNPISQAPTNTWVEGTLDAEGRIHVPLGQYVQYFDMGYGWQTVLLRLVKYNEEEGGQYFIDDSVKEITFTVTDGGNTITMDALGPVDEIDGYPTAMYALVYDDDLTFVGYGDYASVYTPYNMTYATLPADKPQQTWRFTYSNAQEGEYENMPAVVDKNQVYLAGFSVDDPDAALVGTVEGNKVTFSSDQFLGASSGFLAYAFGASYETKTFYDEEWDETYTTHVMTPQPALVMTLDATTNTLVCEGQQALVLNMGKVADYGINYMSVALDPQFALPVPEGVATPVATQHSALRYDLSGRPQRSAVRGITIVNGKKLM